MELGCEAAAETATITPDITQKSLCDLMDEVEFNSSTVIEQSSSDGKPDVSHVHEKFVNIETIGPHHFELLKLIGEGAFGKVILVRNRFSKTMHAMKVLSKQLIKKKNSVQQMKSERDILTKLSHPFLVSLDFAFQTDQKLFLIMEFLSGGELFYHLRKRGHIQEMEMQIYAAEMVLALDFLHSKQVIHRDLKPENILLKGNGHLCITDFGLAKEVSDGTARTLCGTSEYMAPEMLSRTGYSYAVDWWALGVLCYEMLTSKLPFTAKSDKELFKKIMTEKLVCPPMLSAKANALLKGLLEKDITKRLGSSKTNMFSIGGVQALKQHAFFDGINWNALLRGEVQPPIDINKCSYADQNVKLSRKQNAAFVSGQPLQSGDPEVDAALVHFHRDFTAQALSPSILEDVYFDAVTKQAGKMVLDRGESPSNDGYGLGVLAGSNSADADGLDAFGDFAFASAPIRAREHELVALEEEVADTFAKLERKRKERLKKEQANEAKRAALQQAEAETKQQQKRQKDIALLKQKISERGEAFKQKQEKAAQLDLDLVAIQKKLRALRKKLKEMITLKDSGLKLTSEQRDKVSKLVEVESEVNQLQTEEVNILGAISSLKVAEDILEQHANDIKMLEKLLFVEAKVEPIVPTSDQTQAVEASTTEKPIFESEPGNLSVKPAPQVFAAMAPTGVWKRNIVQAIAGPNSENSTQTAVEKPSNVWKMNQPIIQEAEVPAPISNPVMKEEKKEPKACSDQTIDEWATVSIRRKKK